MVAEAARQVGLGDKAVFHCQLAVDEACTNIIEHGYQGEGRGTIEVLLRLRPDEELVIELFDQAPRFDPKSAPEPQPFSGLDALTEGGYGIHFIRKVMDRVHYDRLPGGNRLQMAKRVG